MKDFFALGSFIGSIVAQERPLRILEIGNGGSQYGLMLKACQEHSGIKDGIIDRVAMPESPVLSGGTVYGRVFGEESLIDSELIEPYDFVLMLNLSEEMEPERTRALLEMLQCKVTGQILFLTPLHSQAGFRRYHPIVFLGLDFAYSHVPGIDKTVQAYNVFPKIAYEALPIDLIPAQETVKKMKISFALPHHGLTGGMKALLQQIRHLTKKGHQVSVYFRSDGAKSAIPPWSDLTENDYAEQAVIPAKSYFSEHIQGADVVILGGIHQAPEFVFSRVPAVLWEQGAEAVFGEFGKALTRLSWERLNQHALYRLPVHLIAVSGVIAATLKGIYNRDAFVYPNGVDTEIYHPGEKNNATPVVLLTGHPGLAFKGFRFAFDVLHRAYAEGLRFEVKWAAQVKVIHGPVIFPLEVIISPPQHELAHLYRSADIFLSTSLYESYSLPPLEAMASGTAVIAADCGGIQAYARDGENCILCRQGDVTAMTNALARLLNYPQERKRLGQAGRETALEHSAENVVGILEKRLCSIVQYSRQARGQEPL